MNARNLTAIGVAITLVAAILKAGIYVGDLASRVAALERHDRFYHGSIDVSTR